MGTVFQSRIDFKGYHIQFKGVPRDKLLDVYFECFKRFNVVSSRISKHVQGEERGGGT